MRSAWMTQEAQSDLKESRQRAQQMCEEATAACAIAAELKQEAAQVCQRAAQQRAIAAQLRAKATHRRYTGHAR
jgi:hypothetical protein